MQPSYTKNYLKIYFWQILAIILNLLSLFIVIPQLSSNTTIYGIYSICISSIIFLSYTDMGFVNAGFKYASEYYARKENDLQIKTVGFVSFILLVFVFFFALIVGYLSFYPEIIIHNIGNGEETETARHLLLILALFSPNIVLQRALQIFFGIRLEDYIFQKVQVIINICKILSVFFFFSENRYDIINYFLCCQLFTSAGLLIAFLIANKKYNIGIRRFLQSIRFSKQIFSITKSLAFNSLFVTISWIAFYELDPYTIAKLSGAEAVAYYTIGFTCLSFFRTIFGTLFNPFTARFNHLIALNNEDGLRGLFKKIICLLLPIVVFPIISICILSKPLVYTWVGSSFSQSITIVQFLVASNILAFVAYPCATLLMAKKKITPLYFIAALQIIVYWTGIFIFYSQYNFQVLAIFKFIVFITNGLIYMWLSIRILNIDIKQFLNNLIKPIILPAILLILMLYGAKDFLPLAKDKLGLLLVVILGGSSSLLATMVYYFTSNPFKVQVNNSIHNFKNMYMRKIAT